ncbi:MAG TPA: hypothetical protein PLE81_02665 [Brevundimonas sp.]|mgnify:CR=1 FL=1|jgi:hypothetical protein|uniref:hypothetical protein n=1 Tax=Brevundimonas sp. TaxID=1871086 RepID=UPI002BC0FD40|nr:hypothetical protein [Brevundimonas sp.]HRH19518.1 hypothetical protein [Brevundimonas sp.]
MKRALLVLAAALAFGTAGAAAAQEHDHAAHADHGGHGQDHAAHGDHAAQGEDHSDHAHDAAHFATARHAEHTLRDTIADLQAGTPDYDTMVPELADAVRTQSAAMTPALASLGELQTLEHIAEPAVGSHQFRATFASGQVLTWSIAINDENKIRGLLIQ